MNKTDTQKLTLKFSNNMTLKTDKMPHVVSHGCTHSNLTHTDNTLNKGTPAT